MWTVSPLADDGLEEQKALASGIEAVWNTGNEPAEACSARLLFCYGRDSRGGGGDIFRLNSPFNNANIVGTLSETPRTDGKLPCLGSAPGAQRVP